MVPRKKFFTKEEYKTARFQHLSYPNYKRFIKRINSLRASELLLSYDGFNIPCNLGVLRIVKSKPEKPIKTAISMATKGPKGFEYNFHTFGYVYKVVWATALKKRAMYRTGFMFLERCIRFRPNATHVKKPLCKILKNGLQDYAEHISLRRDELFKY